MGQNAAVIQLNLNRRSMIEGIAMKTRRLTMGQAVVEFLKNQYVERDGRENRFIEGVFGIFGHGCVAGVGQALEEYGKDGLTYYQARNEQAMVHAATAFAKQSRRLRAFACLTSIGPGATNMITGAAAATVNRIPVLLMPGDIFASRQVGPVLQQLESPHSQDMSVNDCFRPVSRYWDRINRPEQIILSLLEAMRVLTSPAETGAVTIALPQDVQTEAFDYPVEFFERRIWHIPRPQPEDDMLRRAAEWIRQSKHPLIIAGGGVMYSEANDALAAFCEATGIPSCETQAGKGALPWDHPCNVGAMGVTGASAANILARDADLVICVGTRLSDFTTMSKTAFANPDVRWIGLNVSPFDAVKHCALPLVCDAKAGLTRLTDALRGAGYAVSPECKQHVAKLRAAWDREVDRLFNLNCKPRISQGEVIGIVNQFMTDNDTVVCAAGGLPGDMHKLWRTRNPKGYHMEYGYSTMGYEIAGSLGVKMADPSREVYVLVGDGSYLMMSNEIVTSVQEGKKLIVVLLDNHGFACIRGLSKFCGSHGFGNDFRFRSKDGSLETDSFLPIDFAANAASLGAHAIRANDRASLQAALKEAKKTDRTTVIVIEVSRDEYVPGYESWWDVAVAEVSGVESVRQARAKYEENLKRERYFL
jgi:3D-(3,5/4)-trihydroxycyclohexane-1,2-dione acylhydrolase (decyclizing)